MLRSYEANCQRLVKERRVFGGVSDTAIWNLQCYVWLFFQAGDPLLVKFCHTQEPRCSFGDIGHQTLQLT